MPTKKKESHHETTDALEWSAPGRPFKKRSKQFYLTALLIGLLLSVILFLFSQYLLIVVVASLIFLSFALASTPPKEFRYRVSSEGVMVEDKFFLWKELYDFYLKEKNGIKSFHLRTEAYFPGELILMLGNENEEKIKNAIITHLPFREYVKPTFLDKASDWLVKNFPLEK